MKIMKKYSAWLSLTTLVMGLLLTVPSLARAQTTKKFEPRQLREDFQIARRCLEEGHSGLYRYTRKADLDRIFDEAEKSAARPTFRRSWNVWQGFPST